VRFFHGGADASKDHVVDADLTKSKAQQLGLSEEMIDELYGFFCQEQSDDEQEPPAVVL
jgi:hypothetical protein